MSKQPHIIYYEDELHDEFAGDHIEAKKIDASYRYIRDDFFGKASHIFWYRIIAIPLAWCYMKLHFHHKIVNKEVLREAKATGYFMYGNHTHFLADALIPTLVNRPKRVSVIVHPNNVSMPFLGKITPALGALPLPDDAVAARNFMKAVKLRAEQGDCVMIYPEAHIWPFYTDIRPFEDLSFRYPVSQNLPAFCLTNTYQKRRFSKRPKIVTYLDGPFWSGGGCSAKEEKKILRDRIYEKMRERAANNSVTVIRYEKIKKSDVR